MEQALGLQSYDELVSSFHKFNPTSDIVCEIQLRQVYYFLAFAFAWLSTQILYQVHYCSRHSSEFGEKLNEFPSSTSSTFAI